MPKIPLLITAVVCFIAGLSLAWMRLHTDKPLAAERPVIVCDVPLTDHTGSTVRLADLRGQPTLLYFGYTFCPDVCPTELGFMMRVVKALGPQANHLQTVFVSVDPQRDTVNKLSEYVALFSGQVRGITGTPDNLRSLAAAFSVYYDRVDPAGAKPNHYLMNHTSTIFVLDAEGRLAGRTDSHATLDEALALVRGVL